ncbi:MAG: response regulator transcription factor [Planctomycetes bacterium]|nr:response regulator transcription factor [Planctomycetota bacterium]
MERRTHPVQIAIVEDRDETREGLARLIDASPGFATVGRFASMEDALAKLVHHAPDVLLTDIGLPGISGIEGVRRFLERFPKLQILMLTVYGDDEHVFEAICAGASGYLLKDTPPERLITALGELVAGGAPMSPEIARKVVTMFTRFAPRADTPSALTPREHELLVLLADGHSYKTAAKELGLAIDTVRFHVRNVYDKLHVHSKSEAVAAALRQGILR